MQNKDIEIFLAAANARNITKASEQLFLSQSVVSTRLKRLEEELGFTLFTRGRGSREIELTPQGTEFVGIASRWQNLFEEASRIRHSSQTFLRIAAPESIYYDLLDTGLVPFMDSHPELNVSMTINDSSEVYSMMESGVIDFGFASYESDRSGIIHRHLYDQTFCIISRSVFPLEHSLLSPDSLNPEKEVKLSGGNFSSVSLWRDKWFANRPGGRIEINSPHMMFSLLKSEGSWAILPEVTGHNMKELYGMKLYYLSDSPDSRKIYLLRHTGKPRTEAEALFNSEFGLI